jgi:hypothetical protein
MKILLFIISFSAFFANAETIPFDLKISGHNDNFNKNLELSDLGEGKTKINFDFKLDGKKYNFDLQSVKLASNRSYPTNLDITIKNSDGKKLGYIFYANNGVKFLKKMGEFGLIINILGKPVDFKFIFDKNKKSNYNVANLGSERFIQDTLIPKFGFQMIRPVVVPTVADGVRSIDFKLDSHPYKINYTIKDIDNGLVQFQHNLSSDKNELLERFYFNAGDLDTLRESMYAVKYFNEHAGAFKLVYYAANGQLVPAK